MFDYLANVFHITFFSLLLAYVLEPSDKRIISKGVFFFFFIIGFIILNIVQFSGD